MAANKKPGAEAPFLRWLVSGLKATAPSVKAKRPNVIRIPEKDSSGAIQAAEKVSISGQLVENIPRVLKPAVFSAFCGTTEVVPFQNIESFCSR
jgi:hypothetical protein